LACQQRKILFHRLTEADARIQNNAVLFNTQRLQIKRLLLQKQ
jgi:hypothetical protein